MRSGRRGQDGKETTSQCRTLDVRRLQRDGLLIPGRVFRWHWTRDAEEVASLGVAVETGRVILDYKHRSNGGEWQLQNYPVYLDWTACNLGGQRAWFLCPSKGCGRRVAKLYSGPIFSCRHCHRLVYQSQRETGFDRLLRRAESIRLRLGWEISILDDDGGKPKGMHWRTFKRLKTKHDFFANAALEEVAQQLGPSWRLLFRGEIP